MKTVSKITVVPYVRNGVNASAVFAGHLTESEVERQMLFQRQTPRRLINWRGVQHKTN